MDMSGIDMSEKSPSTIITPGLVSQQSWQSSKTDITEIRSDTPDITQKNKVSGDTFSKNQEFAHINDQDNNRVYKDNIINKSKKIDNNAEKYIVKLESV